eukprot:CAMPEP_0174328700 /NCGR_PEP_ID=MMETSP0810-20121108/15308_1 /TAXON_ID=73025 ORGANISM="Eutreptiella gymnastica-like, Strain CCMP1594" /NCGR_SAMPLE_ID=MMETSP0810 /ASSEMBLY_ACC=CAM_ASM_000659 /LENGTH=267 /DNA_ID=CAMNT_0015442867 /DNA_START=151 /DNA_END=952 /DNA_ORIENTATION=-
MADQDTGGRPAPHTAVPSPLRPGPMAHQNRSKKRRATPHTSDSSNAAEQVAASGGAGGRSRNSSARQGKAAVRQAGDKGTAAGQERREVPKMCARSLGDCVPLQALAHAQEHGEAARGPPECCARNWMCASQNNGQPQGPCDHGQPLRCAQQSATGLDRAHGAKPRAGGRSPPLPPLRARTTARDRTLGERFEIGNWTGKWLQQEALAGGRGSVGPDRKGRPLSALQIGRPAGASPRRRPVKAAASCGAQMPHARHAPGAQGCPWGG